MIQIYTGNGKGKTTAAIGLAIRAAGAGMKVYIGQFIKKGCYNEIKVLKKIKNIELEQYGRGCFIKSAAAPKDIQLAAAGLEKVKKAISSRKYALVILDEINICLKLKLIPLNAVIDLIKTTPKKIELVLTGRGAPK
ncbi:MAG: cob(I)yrinic acid a,c-diamide adenosyltransferase, partial [Candidatus Omnitrophota bacterium]|nr:cob(I)yrinic acid a,c-diamide adenosyltransferase [Candidatus Omnitrophota bacterium]